LSRFKDLNTLGICLENTSMFANMLRSLKEQCEEDGENEMLDHVIPAIDHIDAIARLFADRQKEILLSRGARVVPVRFIGPTNLRIVVDNTRKEK
jgi:hypothetical protein